MYSDQDIANLVNRVQQLEIQVATKQVTGLPNYGILSKNFFTRALSVFGLNLFIRFLIFVFFSCLSVIIGLALGQNILNSFSEFMQSLQQMIGAGSNFGS